MCIDRHNVRSSTDQPRDQTIPGVQFDNVKDKPLADIWLTGQSFQMYRGTSWMKEPCKGCPRAEIDFGGCRCQAMAFTGDPAATDPACKFSPHHDAFVAAAEAESGDTPPPFVYRRLGGAKADAPVDD